MLAKRLSIFCFLILSFASSGLLASDNKLKIAILATGPEQMRVYSNLFTQFENSTDIQVDVQFFSDINFKKHIRNWVELGTYDVLYWQGGKRLTNLISKQEIVPLSDLIDITHFKQQYLQSTIDAVSSQGQVYALPLGHYIWGFYYNKEVFSEFDLKPPSNWSEFIAINEALKQNGIKPLVQATVDEWPVLAWLDYLALNIGGVTYRNKLLAGEFGASTQDKKLIEAFDYLVSKDLFFANEHAWNWEQPIVSVVRKQAAMTLSGQFIESKAQRIADDKIGFFPFPQFENTPRQTEVAPLEVLVVPVSSSNSENNAKLLEFLIDFTAIDATAYKLGWLSVSNQPSQAVKTSARTRSAQQWLNKTKQQIQYFDRDTSIQTSSSWAQAITQSIKVANVSHIEALSSSDLATSTRDAPDSIDSSKLLSFSTLSGLRGTFFVSKILHHVYKQLGYTFHVNRFDTSDAVINSLRLAADGDLIRAIELPQLEELAIKVPEPVGINKVFLVGKSNTCQLENNQILTGKSLGYKSDAVALQQLASSLSSDNLIERDLDATWQAFEQGNLDYVLMFESDLHTKKDRLFDLCLNKLMDIPVYHYLAKKHAGLVNDVSESLRTFKETDEYKAITNEFGIASLPETLNF